MPIVLLSLVLLLILLLYIVYRIEDKIASERDRIASEQQEELVSKALSGISQSFKRIHDDENELRYLIDNLKSLRQLLNESKAEESEQQEAASDTVSKLLKNLNSFIKQHEIENDKQPIPLFDQLRQSCEEYLDKEQKMETANDKQQKDANGPQSEQAKEQSLPLETIRQHCDSCISMLLLLQSFIRQQQDFITEQTIHKKLNDLKRLQHLSHPLLSKALSRVSAFRDTWWRLLLFECIYLIVCALAVTVAWHAGSFCLAHTLQLFDMPVTSVCHLQIDESLDWSAMSTSPRHLKCVLAGLFALVAGVLFLYAVRVGLRALKNSIELLIESYGFMHDILWSEPLEPRLLQKRWERFYSLRIDLLFRP